MLQYVAACCSVLQCVAVCCSEQFAAVILPVEDVETMEGVRTFCVNT